MFQELYAESLVLDALLEDSFGPALRLYEMQKTFPGLESMIPDIGQKFETSLEDSGPIREECERLKSLLYKVNEDRKKLRSQHFALVCSQALSRPDSTDQIAAEINSLVQALEQEKEEKQQLTLLLSLATKQLGSKNNKQMSGMSTLKTFPKIPFIEVSGEASPREPEKQVCDRKNGRRNTFTKPGQRLFGFDDTASEPRTPSARMKKQGPDRRQIATFGGSKNS